MRKSFQIPLGYELETFKEKGGGIAVTCRNGRNPPDEIGYGAALQAATSLAAELTEQTGHFHYAKRYDRLGIACVVRKSDDDQ